MHQLHLNFVLLPHDDSNDDDHREKIERHRQLSELSSPVIERGFMEP